MEVLHPGLQGPAASAPEQHHPPRHQVISRSWQLNVVLATPPYQALNPKTKLGQMGLEAESMSRAALNSHSLFGDFPGGGGG